MSEQIVEELDDLGQPGPNGELVHWMQRPLNVGPAGVSLVAAGGFVLGVGAAVAVFALAGRLGRDRA